MKTLPALILAAAALSLVAATNIQGAVTPAIVPKLLTTFTNPTPAYGDNFGHPVAAMEPNGVLIGASGDDTFATDAGVAYLFSTSGTLLTTFTNPAPSNHDFLGSSVATLGTDRVLIGAPGHDAGAVDAGAAYLFSTNGALLTIFTNPIPAANDGFGFSVAAVGIDRVLISSVPAGAAYLFSTNGALLTTFTNPTPAAYDAFGYPVAAVGSDRVLIGAQSDDAGATAAGAAYLFSANGALLTTFTNPTPTTFGEFGVSVAAVGAEQVVIGAIYNITGTASAGAAYLFDTNGTLITTFTNPASDFANLFGISVAAVGTDRVLIGARVTDMGETVAVAAYLFSTNGTMLATFTNSTPGAGDLVNISVAAMGTDRALIGAPWDDAGATAAGAAYLFSLEPSTLPAPSLSTILNPSLSTITISWPAPAEGWLLEGTNALPSVAASSWPSVPPPYQTNAGTISVTITNVPATGNQFFRLRQP